MSAKVSFSITTHWKRPRGEAGMTRMASKRLSLGAALEWVLAELPEDAWNVTGEWPHKAVIFIDWAKVPDEIKDGTR